MRLGASRHEGRKTHREKMTADQINKKDGREINTPKNGMVPSQLNRSEELATQ